MGVTIKFDSECLKHINLFQSITKASVKDCIVGFDRVLFVVSSGQAGLAIGKNGANIRNLQRLIKKRVEVVEFNSDLVSFLNNIFRPVRVREFEEPSRSDSRRVIKVSVESDSNQISPKSFVRGKIKKARPLLKKYFDIDDVTIG